jgi:hypothetical protein
VIEQVERRAGGGLSVSGRLEGPAGEFLIVVEQAQVSGSVRLDDGRLFTLGADAAGRPVVEEVDPEGFPGCAGTVLPDPADLAAPPHAGGPLRGEGPSRTADAPIDQDAAQPDARDQIDVLVVFTPAAETAAGGPAAARALAQRSVDEANRAYLRSGIDTRLRLVWRGRTEYDESLDDHLTHLTRLRLPDDGFLDDVIAKRNDAGADVVSLFVDDGEAAGLGYMMQQQSIAFEPFAYSVVYWFAAANNLTLAHEIGHNQGCAHDRDHATDRPVFNDAYGWRFVGNDGRQYRTVMGYLPGQRIANFSNPVVLYQGQPTGRTNKEDNAHAINATAVTVANFRPHRVHPGSVRDFDGNGTDDIGTFDPLTGAWWVGLARPEGTFDALAWGLLPHPAGWSAQVEGDFDGDGWKDVASFDAAASAWWVSRSRGDAFETTLWHQLPASAAWRLQTAADFNGDGRDDLAAFNGATGEWRVAISNGTAFTSSAWGTLGAPSEWTRALAGDFNGDGRDDLAVYDEPAGEWWVGLSSGTGLALALWSRHTSASGWADAAAGDFTGDGRDDLAQLRPSDGAVWVGASTGGAFTQGTWMSLTPGGAWGPLQSGDFDADGDDDVACFSGLDATWWVGLSTGSDFAASPWGTLQPASGWSRHLLGDFDGDGRMDIAGYLPANGEWWVVLSAGDHFDLALWDRFVLPRPDVDTDGDGVFDDLDCNPTGSDAWALPGEVENLTLAPAGGAGSATRLVWPEPSFKGGVAVQYDVLRSDVAWYFDWGSLVCLETNDAVDREALDPVSPAPGAAWFYLVRAGNACGEGSLGVDGQGAPRSALTCP